MAFFLCLRKFSGWNSRSMWVEGRIGSVARRVTALHCNLFSRIKHYAYAKYIVLIREQFQTTSTTFKIKCKKKKVPRDSDILNEFI